MKRLSIKARITLWYTAFLVLVVGALFGYLVTAGTEQSRVTAQQTLRRVVDAATAELEYDDGELEFDQDELEAEGTGVFLSVLDSGGNRLLGSFPRALTPPAVSDANMRQLAADGRTYCVYDRVVALPGYGDAVVRGCISLTDAGQSTSALGKLLLYALVPLIAVAAVGGYLLTRRALSPVRRIIETAERIGESGDLSARIGLAGDHDEIHALAETFDALFVQLEDAFSKEKRFAADASHELRTPVAVILTQSEYALSHPQEQAQSLAVIREEADKMSALLSQLLALSRGDGVGGVMKREPIDAGELLDVCAEQLSDAAEQRGICIHRDIEPDAILSADQTALMRLYINLIENAVRYGRDNGNVYLTLCNGANGVSIRVRDDGVGIAPEEQQRVFDRFYQVDPARSGAGAGLGLSMARHIVRAHGGTLTLRSELGKGSEFSVFLPFS